VAGEVVAMKMWVYIVRRALLLVPVILGVMTITFVVVSQLPVSDRLVSQLGPNKFGYTPTIPCNRINPNLNGTCANPAYQNGLRELGLNQPYEVQWAHYMYDSLTLQWGYTSAHGPTSVVFGEQQLPVATVLSWYLPYTLELAAISLTLILLIAIPIGNYSAVYRNRPIDQGSRVLSFSGFALPGFILATLALVGATIIGGGFTPQCGGQSFPFLQFYGSWPNVHCLPAGRTRPGSRRTSRHRPPVFPPWTR
jgi:peptide/nickel transport system permease protein